jgi:hypothetical protein
MGKTLTAGIGFTKIAVRIRTDDTAASCRPGGTRNRGAIDGVYKRASPGGSRTDAKPAARWSIPHDPTSSNVTRSAAAVSQDKPKIEVPTWRYDINLLYEDEKPEYPETPDDARKHLQDFASARRDKYLSVKRMVAMGHKLLTDNPGACFKDKGDWVPYLIMVRKWCEASEQEA